MAIIGAELLGAGTSLLGGLFGKSKTLTPGRQLQSTVHHAVQAGKAYGFNPLTLLGANVPSYTPVNNAFMGQSIIDAGMMLADGLKNRTREAERANRLESANRRLQSTVRQLTLRPPVPGVFDRRASYPSRASALGVASPAQPSESSDGRLLQDFSSDGQTTQLGVGPDIDEIATGWFIDKINEGKNVRYLRNQNLLSGAYPRQQKFGIVPTSSIKRGRYKTPAGPPAPIYDKNRSQIGKPQRRPVSSGAYFGTGLWGSSFGAMFQ